MKCVGCDQDLTITQITEQGAVTECGGEGEGTCCVLDGDAAECANMGHEPHPADLVERANRQHEVLARGAHDLLSSMRRWLDRFDAMPAGGGPGGRDSHERAQLRDELLTLADGYPGQIRDEIGAAGLPVA